MIWLQWLPWRFFLRRVAHAHGFLDPVALLARMHHFAQPAEVEQPVELLRAGAVFHARGLINSRVIQHNLDWVWPYWIERQFNPADDAFVPRAFSITHVNLTHRNWTAVGLPGCDDLPIVDPRGLLTPLFDGWSLDAWLIADDGMRLLPSRTLTATQYLELGDALTVTTKSQQGDLALTNQASVALIDDEPICRAQLEARSHLAGWLIVALRPYNPEGISFIHEIALSPQRNAWLIDKKHRVTFSAMADRHHVSDYRAGDVAIHLNDLEDQHDGKCHVGMATAAALFRLEADRPRTLTIEIPLSRRGSRDVPSMTWHQSLQGASVLSIPHEHFQFLYDAALRTLVLHSGVEVYPGPYTYKRFWFRDAAFIVHALLCAGLIEPAARALDKFPSRQTAQGYFLSQDGEWDSNGEVLWIMHRFCELTGRDPKPDWWRAAIPGAHWIARKRTQRDSEAPHAGLLPAGFSAEHLGPNDFYFWDDFWGIAGLHAAAALADRLGDGTARRVFQREATELEIAVERSLDSVAKRLNDIAMPASVYRRLDSGAIGSLVASYPLQLYAHNDPRLLATADFLLRNCFFAGGFFQDMIHSGINAYLTLHVAQVLLRAGDPRCSELMNTVAALASPTGQWPEAIHPRTRGGCMGDGQHVWAAAEWVMMIRNCFLREEQDRLILGSGIPAPWLVPGQNLRFGPAPCSFGTVTVTVHTQPATRKTTISWEAAWHGQPPPIEIRLPSFAEYHPKHGESSVELEALS